MRPPCSRRHWPRRALGWKVKRERSVDFSEHGSPTCRGRTPAPREELEATAVVSTAPQGSVVLAAVSITSSPISLLEKSRDSFFGGGVWSRAGCLGLAFWWERFGRGGTVPRPRARKVRKQKRDLVLVV